MAGILWCRQSKGNRTYKDQMRKYLAIIVIAIASLFISEIAMAAQPATTATASAVEKKTKKKPKAVCVKKDKRMPHKHKHKHKCAKPSDNGKARPFSPQGASGAQGAN